MVKENDIFQLHGVAHHAVGAHQSTAPDEGAVAHLGVGADDAGSAQIGRGENLGGFVNPDLRLPLLILLRIQVGAKGQDQLLDTLQCLPGIGELAQIICGNGVVKIIKIGNCIHKYS